MSPVQKYLFWLLLFSAASVASQYGSAVAFPLGTWLGVELWVPFSALSTIPLLDVSRSFVQHYSELAEVEFKKALWHMLLIPTSVAFVCSLIAGLPYTIFWGALVAVNVGGYIDIQVFRWVKCLSRKPHVRMRFSNLAATCSGSAAFFIIAYTDWPVWLGLSHNELAKPWDVLVIGCTGQVTIIWLTGMVIAHMMAVIIGYLEKSEATAVNSGQVMQDRQPEPD
ncbi:hypothetical protein ACWJJH_00700 [Endozoicomonadaceae bacterium StTr2]